jgi:hypothetical protein
VFAKKGYICCLPCTQAFTKSDPGLDGDGFCNEHPRKKAALEHGNMQEAPVEQNVPAALEHAIMQDLPLEKPVPKSRDAE